VHERIEDERSSQAVRLAMLEGGQRSQGIHLLVALAGLCLLAQSSLLPVLGTDASSWNLNHTHISFDGVVPPHTHAYDNHHATDSHPHRHEASCMPADGNLGNNILDTRTG